MLRSPHLQLTTSNSDKMLPSPHLQLTSCQWTSRKPLSLFTLIARDSFAQPIIKYSFLRYSIYLPYLYMQEYKSNPNPEEYYQQHFLRRSVNSWCLQRSFVFTLSVFSDSLDACAWCLQNVCLACWLRSIHTCM